MRTDTQGRQAIYQQGLGGINIGKMQVWQEQIQRIRCGVYRSERSILGLKMSNPNQKPEHSKNIYLRMFPF